jgi:hypothetical protein
MARRLATVEEFTAIATGFCDVPPEVTRLWLELAGQEINLQASGDKSSQLHILLTAHNMTVAGEGKDPGERGPVTAEEIDKIKVAYGATGSADGLDANYATTNWGRLYLAKKKTLFVVGMVGRRVLLTPR